MADKHKIESLVDFEWDILNMKGSLSQLLFSDGIINRPNITHLNLNPPSSPKMLCFGSPKQSTNQTHSLETTRNRSTSKKSSPSENHNTQSKGPKPQVRDQVCPTIPAIVSGKPSKRMKAENSPPTSSGHAKVKRQGLGERVAALQQLVSPYGKTDTASVLHEAMGYIRFLHDQVQVLCSPYLDEVLPSATDGGENRGARKNLRSRGLCLVPAACTLHVANSNGADFWSPAMAVGLNSDFFTSSDIH